MAVRQLLIREQADGGEHLEAVPVPPSLEERPAGVAVPEGATAPLLGTADLIDLATAMTSRGYRVVGLDVRDSRFGLIPDEQADLIASDLVGHLRAARVQDLHDELEALRLRVVSIELQTPNRDRVRLLRDGTLLSPEYLDPSEVLEALQESWRGVFPA